MGLWGLRMKMVACTLLLFAIFYALFVSMAFLLAGPSTSFVILSGILAFLMMLIQYMIGPRMVEWSMGVRYVNEAENPRLHRMVEELSRAANIPKPRVGVSDAPIPNAFAFGRGMRDARVCVTRELERRLDDEELKAVLAHEISHIKHRDVAVITALSVIPMICYYIYLSFFWGGGNERGARWIIALLAFVVYFITNLVVLYASRVREYYADFGSVKLTGKRHTLASALYKIVYGSARVNPDEVRKLDGMRAFFAADPRAAVRDLSDLRSADLNLDGRIDEYELEIFAREARVGRMDKIMELFSTHPNLVKRVKALAEL